MESRLFDLQHEIRNYFNRLHSGAVLTENDEKELESHINEGVDFLEKKGLTVEEAFLVTIKRLGKTDILSAEYNKVNSFIASDRIRSHLITCLGLILSLGTIFLFIYEVTSLFRNAYLAKTNADMVSRTLLYFGLCISVLMVFKWGKSFTIFLQKNIEQGPLVTVFVLFLLPLLNFISQPALIRYFKYNNQVDSVNFKSLAASDIQFVNLGFFMVALSVLFLSLVSYESASRQMKFFGKKVYSELPVIFLVLFSMVICMVAAVIRFIPESNIGHQNAIFIAVIYAIGSFSIAFDNNDKLWLKLSIFAVFGVGLGNLLGI